ncbi:phage tail tube protein [Pseudodesulfovibrio tunisiensis]|uniref:phage tail tube protein n=1 Tax=Pseudodesulfovibrio tunisiensis TaxID=463192 RepID=UPI001FB2CD13|nr:phage tail tube protein [Pseudodesulfovibrio tunisiensis]
MTQARGYKGKLLVDIEAAFGVAPTIRKTHLMPYNTCDLSASREQNTAATITGSRNPVAPFQGNVDVQGTAEVPVDAHSFGLWLVGMFGMPTTSAVAAVNLDAGDAVDKGSGKVGLPATGHGFEAGATIVLSGTTSYDGAHILQPETSSNELVILASFTGETFSTTDEAQLAARVNLDAGDAVDKGNGLVGLSAAGHGLAVGAEIVIAGTTNYDGTYMVKRGTSIGEIVIEETYAAETFDGSETVTALFRDHVFKIAESMPSLGVEKQFPDIPAYLLASGIKIGSCALSVGGSDELTASLSLVGRDETRNAAVYDANPVELPFNRFGNFQARIIEGGTLLSSRNKTVNINLDFGLDTDQYTLGDGGVRGDIPEGLTTVSGDIEALFTDTRFLDKAEAGTRSSVEVQLVNGGYKLSVAMPEVEYQRKTPGLAGPRGVLENFSFAAFHDTDSAGSAVVVTLRNEIKNWTE